MTTPVAVIHTETTEEQFLSIMQDVGSGGGLIHYILVLNRAIGTADVLAAKHGYTLRRVARPDNARTTPFKELGIYVVPVRIEAVESTE